MRRLFPFLLVLILSCVSWGQGSSFTSWTVNAAGKPIVATVKACQWTASPVVPCINPVTIYSDQTLATPVANPITTDGSGNFTLYSTPGFYIVQSCIPNTTLCVTQTILLPIANGTDAQLNSITISGYPVFSGVCPGIGLNPADYPGLQVLAVDSDCQWKFLKSGVFKPILPQVGTKVLAAGTGTVVFSPAFVATPVCVANDQTALADVKPVPTNTQVVFTGTGADTIAYACYPNPN